MSFFTFQLNTDAAPTATAPDSTPFTRVPINRRPEAPSDSCSHTGDFDADRESGTYTYEWPSMVAFQDWLAKVQREHVVEFVKQHTDKSLSGAYLASYEYKCARGHVRGTKDYVKKHPERTRKVEPKAAGCKAGLHVRTYHNTETVLGRFTGTHSHPIGDDNARFTRIPLDTRMKIAELLRNGVDPDRVLKDIHDDAMRRPVIEGGAGRESFVTRADVRRIQAAIEAEQVRLDRDDGISSSMWIQRWLAQGDVLSFKSCDSPAPDGSGLAPRSFHLIIQTDWQRERFRELGESFAGIDGTHNTTCYENTTLFTVLVRDKWGHGIPVAWMLSSDGTQPSLENFLRTLRAHNPTVVPKRFMTDRDQAQINALTVVYPESEIFYCWWHVLHAWQQHFSTTAYPELWELLKSWIRITCREKFAERWASIQGAAPASFLQYLQEYWMSDRQQAMWSAVHRQNRHIFEESDTNMLVEAWHHVLKGKFLNGKRNRRLDTLICLLHDDVLRHYALRYHRQLHGFEGQDLEAVERVEIAHRAQEVTKERIEAVGDGIYNVTARAIDGIYTVNTDTVSCTCFAFPRIKFCKHLAAVELHFPAPAQQQRIVLTASRREEGPLSPDTNSPTHQDAPTSSAHVGGSTPSSGPSLDDVTAKMRRFLARAAVTTHQIDQAVLNLLDVSLTDALERTVDSGVLPKAVAIPPNVKSATETARILPRHKTKRKLGGTLREKEPYSGGERSGKKAKQDALHPPPPSHTRPVAALPDTVSPASPALNPAPTHSNAVVRPPQAAALAATVQAAAPVQHSSNATPFQHRIPQYHAAEYSIPRGPATPMGYMSTPYLVPNGAHQQQPPYHYPALAANPMPPPNPYPYHYYTVPTAYPPPSHFYSHGPPH